MLTWIPLNKRAFWSNIVLFVQNETHSKSPGQMSFDLNSNIELSIVLNNTLWDYLGVSSITLAGKNKLIFIFLKRNFNPFTFLLKTKRNDLNIKCIQIIFYQADDNLLFMLYKPVPYTKCNSLNAQWNHWAGRIKPIAKYIPKVNDYGLLRLLRIVSTSASRISIINTPSVSITIRH